MQIQRFQTMDDLTGALVALLSDHLYRAPEQAGPYGIMLAGGQTPLAAYVCLARKPVPAAKSLRVLFSDERLVPRESEESNAGRAWPMLQALRIPANRILAVNPELKPAAAAAQYDRELAGFFRQGGHITVGLLGLGADGHTAGLFSLDDLARSAGHYAVTVRRPDGLTGVTVTPGLLQRVATLYIVTAGPNKQKVAERLLADPQSLIAGRVAAGHPDVRLWVA